MSYEHVMEIGQEGYLSGLIEPIDRSFSHALGYEKRTSFEVYNFKLAYFMDGSTEIDVTICLTEKQVDELKEKLIEDFIEKNHDDLINGGL